MKVFFLFLLFTGCALKLKQGLKNKHLPNFIYSSSKTCKAYFIAKNRGKTLNEYPCYCGCMKFNGHKGLYNCFFKEDGTPDEHGSECDMCIDEIIKVDEELKKGTNKEEIKTILEREFGE